MSTETQAATQAGQDGQAEHAPSDRATTFQAVQGEPEHYSGEKLLVGAYAIVWVVILAWVALVWRKQSALTTRLDDLERVLAEAEARRGAGDPASAEPRSR
jgi:CcmD family protein